MVAGRPWYQRNPADFIMAVRGFELEVVGAYSLIIDHLNERDRPLPDDDRFMAGLLHCSTQRWRKIKAMLIERGKIIITAEGYLTNGRFDRELAQRRGEHEVAVLYGRAGGLERARRAGQTELDLDAGWEDAAQPPAPVRARAPARTERVGSARKVGEVLPEVPQQSRGSSASHSQTQNEKPRKINDAPQPPPQAPCARVESRDKRKDSSLPTVSDSSPRDRLDDLTDHALLDVVCQASGFCPVSPAQIERSLAQITEWRRQGVSFDEVAIPVIRSVMAQTPEPTRTLGRFKVPIAHEHARLSALQHTRQPYQPPVALTVEDDPDPRIAPIRDRLRKELGPRAYDGWLKPTAMSFDGPSLIVTCPSKFMADWVEAHFGSAMGKIAGVRSVRTKAA